jgi:hypothetical protein
MLAAQNAGFGQAGLSSLAQAAGGVAPTGLELAKAGLGAAASDPSALVSALGGGKQALQYGMAAAAPVMADQMVPTVTQAPIDRERLLYQYDRPLRDPNEGYTGPYSGERAYFGDATLTRVGMAAGGAVDGLAKGGFVVPADVVSMLGEGSTDAGLRALQAKYGPTVSPIKGPGTGQSDSITTSIEGRAPARVADGEAYIPPQTVAKHGGAKKLYDVLNKVRVASQGHAQQQRRVNPRQVLA